MVNFIETCWAVFRVTCRSFAEGTFIYLLINTKTNKLNFFQKFTSFNKKKWFVFSFLCSCIAIFVSIYLNFVNAYRLVIAVFVFFYFWYKHRKSNERLLINYNNIQDIRYALTTAILSVLTLCFSASASHISLHTFFVLTGIYNTICSAGIFRQLYKTAVVFLDVFFIFLVYKFQFIKMKDIKAMSVNKWVPISFGCCLLLIVYADNTYYFLPVIEPYRDILLWVIALMLPMYIGFYLIMNHQSQLVNIKENYAADVNIYNWFSNPSILETDHLSICNSNVFVASFESKKIVFRKKLDKLGINNKYKGYSELIFCLFLTRLFVGMENWSFEKDIFGQASLIIDVSAEKLCRDIEDIIEQVWNTREAEALIDGYYLPYRNINIYDQTKSPTVEEFLTDIAESV